MSTPRIRYIPTIGFYGPPIWGMGGTIFQSALLNRKRIRETHMHTIRGPVAHPGQGAQGVPQTHQFDISSDLTGILYFVGVRAHFTNFYRYLQRVALD